MFKSFRQFVPSQVCLKCDGCCRFKEEDSRWRPLMTVKEQQEAAKPAPVEKIFNTQVMGADSRIKTISCAQGHLCHFLNANDNTCGIYHARPFECQLYPFLLGLKEGQPVLYVHLNCPFIQEYQADNSYQAYVQYLKEFFSKAEVKDYFKNQPALFSDYTAAQDELMLCFNLPFNF